MHSDGGTGRRFRSYERDKKWWGWEQAGKETRWQVKYRWHRAVVEQLRWGEWGRCLWGEIKKIDTKQVWEVGLKGKVNYSCRLLLKVFYFPVQPIIRLLVRGTSGLLNKAFDNKVLTPPTRPEGAQGRRQWGEAETAELLQSHSQSSVTPSVSLPSDNF